MTTTTTHNLDQIASAPVVFQVDKVRADFPILKSKFYGKPLVYLDNAATTQKPQQVIDAIEKYYRAENANIHRAVYTLSQIATNKYEDARRKLQKFLNAGSEHEIIFTRGTTESINLVAACYGRHNFKPGDEVIISAMEHHSNIVPWQMICQATGAVLRVVPMNDNGEFLFEEYTRMLSEKTKLVSVVHVSNSLGTVNPVKQIIDAAHRVGAVCMIDGAQWVAHGPTDVRALDADFYALSSHKLFGPTGIGVLYGKEKLLNAMPPYQGGGDMISSVTFAKTTYNDLPYKFEAGTPHIAGGIGFGAAMDYLKNIDLSAAAAHEQTLLRRATEGLQSISGLKIIGTAQEKAGAISFTLEGVASHDLGTLLDADGIAIRTGHHCCQPVMDRFKIPSTARASFAMYNTMADVDALVKSVEKVARAHAGSSAKSQAANSNPAQYPEPAAVSPNASADQLAELFEFLGDRDSRNQYLLEAGEKIPAMPDSLKTDDTRVHGCMSTVHLFARPRPDRPGSLDFLADSDAHIVRGLIAVLEKLFAGQQAKDILAFDVAAFFNRIGLDQFISTQRRNGLQGMVKKIRAYATEMLK